MKKAITPEKMTALCALAGKGNSNSTEAQERRVLEFLLTRTTGINRYEAERQLGICHLAARIVAIKEMGYPVLTIRERATDPYGQSHNGIARYFITGGVAPVREAA